MIRTRSLLDQEDTSLGYFLQKLDKKSWVLPWMELFIHHWESLIGYVLDCTYGIFSGKALDSSYTLVAFVGGIPWLT